MIVLDASVIIAHLDADDAHHEAAENLLAANLEHEFAASVITRAEVLVGPARQGRRRAIEDVLDLLELRTLPLAVDAAGQLAELRAISGLRLPDCCVLHAAEASSAQIGAFDQRLARAARSRGVTVLGADSQDLQQSD